VVGPIDPIGKRRTADEVSQMRKEIVTLLCVTGLAAAALLGSRLVSVRWRKAEPQPDSAEYWYPYLQA